MLSNSKHFSIYQFAIMITLFRVRTPHRVVLLFWKHWCLIYLNLTRKFKFSTLRSCQLRNILSTVWLNRIAHFSVHILLLHHYKRNLAHLSYLYSLVIVMYKYETRAKNNWKWGTSSASTKFAHFWVVLVRNLWSKST